MLRGETIHRPPVWTRCAIRRVRGTIPRTYTAPPNRFLHVAIVVDGLPRLGGEAVRRAIEEGLASSLTQRHGSPYFSGGCHSPRRELGTSIVSAVEVLTAVGRLPRVGGVT